MIEFELEISPKYRGGDHYCYFSANSPSELVKTITDKWNRSGLSPFGGEFFLYAYLKDADGNEVKFFYGNCACDIYGKLGFVIETINYEGDDEDWYSFGLFSTPHTDDFDTVFNELFDYDSPERVLGAYGYKVCNLFDSLTAQDKKLFDAHVIANILDFGKKHGKLMELFQWLFDGNVWEIWDYRNQKHHKSSPEVIALSKATTAEELEVFIDRYKKDFGITIYLPSTV
jgi:hypothetical protein